MDKEEQQQLSEVQQKITVKFVLARQEKSVAQNYPLTWTVAEMRADIAGKFQVNPMYLQLLAKSLYHDGEQLLMLTEEMLLSELPKNEFGIIEVHLDIDPSAPSFIRLELDVYYSHFQLPDMITVYIPAVDEADGEDLGIGKRLIVEIVNDSITKPFLGGFRNKCTQVEYHDAFSQTGPSEDRIKTSGILTRPTQTIGLHTKSETTATNYDSEVQHCGYEPDYIDPAPLRSDYVVTPNQYTEFDDTQKRDDAARLLQVVWRTILLKRFIKKSAAKWRANCEEQQRREEAVEALAIGRAIQSCAAKTFPKTKADFDLLYAQLQMWKKAEMTRIKNMYVGASRISEIARLLDQEIILLNGIERQRVNLIHELEAKRAEQTLVAMAEPLKWVNNKNCKMELDLLRTQRARKLKQLYDELKAPVNNLEKRLTLIKNVMDTIESDPCEFCESDEKRIRVLEHIEKLLNLFDREMESLKGGLTKKGQLNGLRERQNMFFVEFIKRSSVPSVKVKNAVKIKMCSKCRRGRDSIKSFELDTRQGEASVCRNCTQMGDQQHPDLGVYRNILRSIRRDERKRGALASYAFIIQAEDIRLIVETIFHGHSVISQCNDMQKLRLPRWLKSDDWSPWNCVLLTDKETRYHLNIKGDLKTVYDQHMIKVIESKLFMSRQVFGQLHDFDHEFVESGDWWRLPEWKDIPIK